MVIVDQATPQTELPPGVRYVNADVSDVGAMAGALRDSSALVHLAGIPAPNAHPDEVVYANNTVSTFAVLQAASLVGVRRVALASSGSAYGTAWSPEPSYVLYVPVDEDHPLLNADPYGLSKEVCERIAEMFCRRDQMSIAALRFHWIVSRETQLNRISERRRSPDWVDEARNLWGYVDLRDAARACRLAIEVAATRPYGFAAMNIVAADNLAEEPIEELLAAHVPGVEVRGSVTGTAGAFSIERAREVLGWEPEFSWRRLD